VVINIKGLFARLKAKRPFALNGDDYKKNKNKSVQKYREIYP
jgi:hypothetical protein